MSIFQANIPTVQNFLLQILKPHLDAKSDEWLNNTLHKLQTEFDSKSLYFAFGIVPRYLAKTPLKLTEAQIAQANTIRKGWHPQYMTSEEAARVILLLTIPTGSKEDYLKIIANLFDTADVGEFMALYAAFPVLQFPKEIEYKQAEGVRTNMTSIFEKIAFHNPYSSEYLNEDSWNQMVIKTIFIDKNINQIYGLDERRNYKLSRIASDLAHERWAAGRPVRPELWRLVVPFVDAEMLPNIKKLLDSDLDYELEAGVLLASESKHPDANILLKNYEHRISKTALNWDILAEKYLLENLKNTN